MEQKLLENLRTATVGILLFLTRKEKFWGKFLMGRNKNDKMGL